MTARAIELQGFDAGVDLSVGDYPPDPRLLRAGDNVLLTSGATIEMRPPVKRLDVQLDSRCQGLVPVGCKLCVIAKAGENIVHTGSDAPSITTLFFDSPDYCTGDWELLGVQIYNNLVIADIRHVFELVELSGVVHRHVLDPADPTRSRPGITKPTYIEDPYCPTNWNPTRPLHLYRKGEAGLPAPAFAPKLASAAQKLVSSRPDGNVAFSATANPFVWNSFSADDWLDVGEMWYWIIPDTGDTLFRFVVSDRFDKLDDDRAWSAYVLEYLDAGGRWRKFIEVPDIPSVNGQYSVSPIDGRWGDAYNEICLLVRWTEAPGAWIRWRAIAGGPPMTLLDGGELLEQTPDTRDYAGDDVETKFPTDIGFDIFRLHWWVRLSRTDAGGTTEIPLMVGSQMHYVVTPYDVPVETWQATTGYTENESFVDPTTPGDLYFQCVAAGTSGGSEPTWPTTAGDTVTDGTVTWLARDRDSDLRLARIDFGKYSETIRNRCDDSGAEHRYTTNIRYETVAYIPAFQPALWLNPAEDTLVPITDYHLEDDDGYIRVVWDQNLPAAGTYWTLKFAPTSSDDVLIQTTARHFSGGRYIFEGEVWEFSAIELAGMPAEAKVLAGVPHVPLLFGAVGDAGNEVFAAGTHSFVVPAGVTMLLADAWGAGGGGGGAIFRVFFGSYRSGAGGGGGGGAFNQHFIPVTPGETLTIEVGAGGAAGSSYFNQFPTVCGVNPPTAGAAGGNTRIKRGVTVLVEVGGGQGGLPGDYNPLAGGVGGAGGAAITPATAAAGEDGDDGASGARIGWPAPCPIDGGAGGYSGAGDVYGRGGVGANAACALGGFAGWTWRCRCPDICEPTAGSEGRVKLSWGTSITPWFQVVSESQIPLDGYERYNFLLRKRLTIDAAGAVAGDEDYVYGNEPGKESLFFVEKQSYYQDKLAGKDDAGFLDTAARTQPCGEIVAISGIQNRLAVHFSAQTYLYAFYADPTQNAFLDDLHFGSRGPTTEFFGGIMLLTQQSFRAMDLGGLNYDSLRENNVGRPVEPVDFTAIHAAAYWPYLGAYLAVVEFDGDLGFAIFSFCREKRVAGWTFARVRNLVTPAVDSLHPLDDRLYFRTDDLVRYFDAKAGAGAWLDDEDELAYQAAYAAATEEEKATLRREDFKYPARVRFHLNDLRSPGTMKKWLWMDLVQSTRCETGFYERPEDDARRKIGPTFNGNSLHRRRTPLVMRNEAVGLELLSRSLDGWELRKIVLGVAQSRR